MTTSARIERARIREHVSRVGEERERVRRDPDHDLDGHQAEDQRERDPQVPLVRALADVDVVVARVLAHGIHDRRRGRRFLDTNPPRGRTTQGEDTRHKEAG